MNYNEKNVYTVLLLVSLVAVTSLILQSQLMDNSRVSSGYEKIIWTNKEAYELGETIEAAIVFINKGDQQLEINPIYSFTFSGNSVYDPKQVAGGVFVDYADPKITIPANGNITFTKSSFTPTYPGPFKITGLGLTKTVNVTGYKEATLNSTGIRLFLEPSKTTLKDRDYVEITLVIKNDNPYPVKIPVFSPIYTGETPDELYPSIYISWLYPHFTLEANSSYTHPIRGDLARYPGFSLYVSVEGVKASIELEVDN